MAPRTELAVGEEVDRFVVEARLGEGGVAVVYRVRHRTLDSVHALKLLRVASAEQRQRLAAEGRAQAALRHPNVVRVTDVVEREGALGLIVDYIDGPSLEELLREGPLPLEEAVELGQGIIAGVAAAHAAGIVHRDLKPANVLLTRTGDGAWQPHVADFGIAKALDVMDGPTRTGFGMGTPGYMAPEQYQNAAGVDHRADIFSLGCLLYALVCGRPPFLGDSVVEVFQLAARGDYPFPRDLCPALPLRLAHALEEALEPNPVRRFSDCAGLLAAWRTAEPAPAAPRSGAPSRPGGPRDPRRYGDYVVDEKLGQGGMGEVWRAHPVDMKRTVALKTISVQATDRDQARARFVREIDALSRCSHPNIVRIFHHGEDHGQLYYVMEFIEGTDLQQIPGPLIDPSRTLAEVTAPPASALPARPIPSIQAGAALFAAAAEGLQHLHDQGVVHRDLKPANLMLTADGKRLVVMDLGLAQLSDASRALTAMDVKVLGTLRYMPPEQLQRNLLGVDHRADIYALAATFTEVLTGAPLFDGDTEQRVIQQVLHEAPAPARLLNPDIPANLELVLQKAMAKRPDHRYPTAAAFAADLRAVAEDRPVSVRRPSVAQRLRRTMGRNPVAAAVLLTAVVMMTGGSATAAGALVLRLEFGDDRAKHYERVVKSDGRWEGQDWIPDRDWIDPLTASVLGGLRDLGFDLPFSRALRRDPDAPSVRIRTFDGLPSELEWVAPDGTPSPFPRGAHRIRQSYHRDGAVSEVEYLDQAGTVLWREHRDVMEQSEAGTTTLHSSTDADRHHIADPLTGTFQQEWTTTHTPQTKRVRYLDADGQPAHTRSGVWARLEAQDDGPPRAWSTTWLGPAGAPAPGPDGVDRSRHEQTRPCELMHARWSRCDTWTVHLGTAAVLDDKGRHKLVRATEEQPTPEQVAELVPEPVRAALQAAAPALVQGSEALGTLTVTSSTDTTGAPAPDKQGVSTIYTLTSLDGRTRVKVFADEAGLPAPRLDGPVAWLATFDDDERPTEHRFLDATGALTPTHHGYAVHTIDRSTPDRERHAWLGADGTTPVPGPYGASVREEAYVGDLRKSVRFLGADGEPAENSDGMHIAEYEHDDAGRRTLERYLDAALQPVVHPDHGYATRRRVFDGLGRVVETTLLDASGQLAAREDGPARWTTEHDDAGRPERHTSLSLAGEPVPCALGYTVETIEHGVEQVEGVWQRDVATHRYGEDDDGQLRLVPSPDGVARRVVFADAAGRVVEERRFDAAGAPVGGEPGCPRTVSTRDRFGRLTAEQCQDGRGQPTSSARGVARKEQVLDAFGRVLEERWLDAEGALVDGPEGAARRVHTYAVADEPLESRSFDASGAERSPRPPAAAAGATP